MSFSSCILLSELSSCTDLPKSVTFIAPFLQSTVALMSDAKPLIEVRVRSLLFGEWPFKRNASDVIVMTDAPDSPNLVK
jgi:hypothetical protein